MLSSGGPREGARRGEWRNEAIAPPRQYIPLPDQARRPCHQRSEQRRDRNVATSREEDIRSNAAQVADRLRNRAREGHSITKIHQGTSRALAQAWGTEQCQRVSLIRDDFAFNAALAAEPVNLSVWSLTLERTSYGEARKEVSPRTAARDHHAH